MPRMNIRGLCVCSFGLRTIAVLMSLFPSLGISSFHTAVCCDGENEYTTPAHACQQDFVFFLDFFAFFLFRDGGRLSGLLFQLEVGQFDALLFRLPQRAMRLEPDATPSPNVVCWAASLILQKNSAFALRFFAPLRALFTRSVNFSHSDLELTTRKP